MSRPGKTSASWTSHTTTSDCLSGTDWWMFDEARIVHLNYRSDGTQINRELFRGDIAPYLEWKRVALVPAVPFAEYVTGLG